MKKIGRLLAVVVFILVAIGYGYADDGSYGWASPSAKAIKHVSPVDSSQHEPNFLNNLDCDLVDYRVVRGGEMRTGCFTPTAFGMLDSDSDTAIFNGTDEGLPLLPSSPHQVLAPWPNALNLLALDAANNGGSYVSMYKNPLVSLKDQRNLLSQLTAKQFSSPPDLQLKDSNGNRLAINPQSLAFSAGGSWMVAETFNGHFERINLASLDVIDFALSYGSSGSPALLKSQVAVSDDGQYVAIANQVADVFKVYDLNDCSQSVCKSYDYLPFIKQQIGGFQSVRHIRFVNSGLLSFEALSSNTNDSGIYELAPTSSIDSLIEYLGMGDSYTSGEGAYDYLTGTDTGDNVCHLSINSYPLLITKDLFTNTGGHSVACSGAVINDIGSTSNSYRGQVRGVPVFDKLPSTLLNSVMANFLPGYIAQQRFAAYYQPKIITVSIGGNDVGFGDMLQNCVMPHVSLHLSDSNCYNTYEDRVELTNLIDKTSSRLTTLYKQLKTTSPSSNIYAVGYPSVVYDKGNCGLNAHLGKSELEFSEEVIDYLNNSVKNAASKAGVSYVDISKALAGHRLCETTGSNVAVNGLTAGKDGKVIGLKVFGKESYHPNKLGQSLIEQEILKQTNNLKYRSASTPSSASTALLNAPKSGRAVTKKAPAKITSTVVKKSQAASLKVSGLAAGLKPNTAYKVKLDGSNGKDIGNVTTDDNSDVDGSITLPSDISAGGHTIDITGPDQSDNTVDLSQPIYVPVNDEDSDGDGIDDAQDSCPAAINSGYDQDNDGIDDTCDGYISGTGSNTSSSTPSSADTSPSGGGTNAGSISVRHPITSTKSLNVVPVKKATILKGAYKKSNTPRRSSTTYQAKTAGNVSVKSWIFIGSAGLFWLWLLLAVLYIWWATNRDKPTYQYRRLL